MDKTIETLETFNKWRRGDESISINDISPKLIGIAIDDAVRILKELRDKKK